MKELKKWNNNPIKIMYLIPSGNKYAYIKLGDTVDLTNGTYKITALDNEENIFQAVNMDNKDDCVIMYAYEVV